ncbi:MAG: class I SAM-dependent methyltransferase [Solirubrobacteraceae bacterium]
MRPMDGSSETITCPACQETETTLARRHTVQAAAEHLIPMSRDGDRNARLQAELRGLFGAAYVDVRACATCGFWFADPFVAGTPEIYNLVTQGDELYPQNRFEFDLTLSALSSLSLDLLEIGAGDGAFLRRARGGGLSGRICATEYDDGSLASIRAIAGVEAFKLGPIELAAAAPGRFDVVCMFQVLEHMDRLDEVFSSLRTLVAVDGQLFIGVPNDASVTWQEQHTGYWEMPPNHVGRWTRGALEHVGSRHGFRVLEHRYEPVSAGAGLWEMAKYRAQARAYDASTVTGRINSIAVRAVRGPAKRMVAIWDLAVLAPTYGKIPPRSQWFRLGAA